MSAYWIGTATRLQPGDPASPELAVHDDPSGALADAWHEVAHGAGIPFVYRIAQSPDARIVMHSEPLTAELAWQAIQISALGNAGRAAPGRALAPDRQTGS